MPEVFQMITEKIATKNKKNQGIFRTNHFPPVSSVSSLLHCILLWLVCVYSYLASTVPAIFIRASFHLILACSQLCTFSALSSTEVISHYRSYSSHSCVWTPEEPWECDCLLFKSFLPSPGWRSYWNTGISKTVLEQMAHVGHSSNWCFKGWTEMLWKWELRWEQEPPTRLLLPACVWKQRMGWWTAQQMAQI